jgi:predicted AAA+ superfamily ATPase
MSEKSDNNSLQELLERMASALERAFPPEPQNGHIGHAPGYVWSPAGRGGFRAVSEISAPPLKLLSGIERQKETLLANTESFARGHGANNALLWGARGMGKSSLVKAAFGHVRRHGHERLKLVEIHREDIASLPRCLELIRKGPHRTILFCDDLSFDEHDSSYKSLKAALEGGLEGRPRNLVFYATSNRRHLLAREMMENENSSAINPGDAASEKISLSDRFGLWLGFHNCSQDEYLAMARNYRDHYRLDVEDVELEARAIEWAATRGARSGRVARQFIEHLAGRLGRSLDEPDG